jgi:hypothetical protein
VRVQQSRSGFRKTRLYFIMGLSTQNNREVTKNKAALSTKKPRSVPGFIVRVQQSRSGFRKTRFFFSTAFQHKKSVRSQKIKLAVAAVAKAAHRYQSYSPLLKPLPAVKAAYRCQGRPPLLKPLAAAKATRRC